MCPTPKRNYIQKVIEGKWKTYTPSEKKGKLASRQGYF